MMNKGLCKIEFVVGVTFIVFLSSCSTDDYNPLRTPDGTSEKEEIDWAATADSMQKATYDYYLGTEGTFTQDNSGNSTFHYWPNAHVLNALVDAYNRTGDAAYISKMKSLLRGIKSKNGGSYLNVFNDDMLWLANASVRAYEATENDPEYLDVANILWDDIRISWSDDILGGGITWKKDTPYEKNAVSNGPAAILGARLYEVERNPEDIEWSKKIYDWEKTNLVDPESGLVWDGIKLDNGKPVINKDWIFTYNIGTFIGSGIKLYQLTGEKTYLNDAVKTARAMMTSPKLTTEGILKDEGQGDGGLFKGILVRYLTELIQEPSIAENDRRDLVNFLQFNAETFYKYGLSRPKMLASPDWRNAPGAKTDLTTQLSGLMLIEAAALLDQNGYFKD